MTHNLVNYGTIKEFSGIGVSEPFEILFCLSLKSFMYYWDYIDYCFSLIQYPQSEFLWTEKVFQPFRINDSFTPLWTWRWFKCQRKSVETKEVHNSRKPIIITGFNNERAIFHSQFNYSCLHHIVDLMLKWGEPNLNSDLTTGPKLFWNHILKFKFWNDDVSKIFEFMKLVNCTYWKL